MARRSPIPVRFDPEVARRLSSFAASHPGLSLSAAANLLVDEGLRTTEHPGIVFRPGPTGRRAALAGGPDVWEVIAPLNAIRAEDPDLDGDDLASELATVTGLSAARVAAALRYYAAYPDQIHEPISNKPA